MTELQKQLLGELKNTNTPSVIEEKVEVVSLPTSAKEVLSKPTERVPRDEYNLTYDELIEEFNLLGKSAIMKPSTFDRLWNI